MNKNNESKKNKTYLTDGMITEKDFLMTLSAGVFFLFVSIGLVIILLQKTFDPMYLSLLDMVSEVVMTIVISVFGVDGIGKVTSYLEKRSDNKTDNKSSANTIHVEKAENVYEAKPFEEDNSRKEDDII